MPLPSPGDLPDPGIELRSPALQADALSSKPSGKVYLNSLVLNMAYRTPCDLMVPIFPASIPVISCFLPPPPAPHHQKHTYSLLQERVCFIQSSQSFKLLHISFLLFQSIFPHHPQTLTSTSSWQFLPSIPNQLSDAYTFLQPVYYTYLVCYNQIKCLSPSTL